MYRYFKVADHAVINLPVGLVEGPTSVRYPSGAVMRLEVDRIRGAKRQPGLTALTRSHARWLANMLRPAGQNDGRKLVADLSEVDEATYNAWVKEQLAAAAAPAAPVAPPAAPTRPVPPPATATATATAAAASKEPSP